MAEYGIYEWSKWGLPIIIPDSSRMSGRNPNAPNNNNGNLNLKPITGNRAVVARQHELAALAGEEEGILRGPYFHSLSVSNQQNYVDQLTPVQLNMYRRERALEKIQRKGKVSRKNRKSRKNSRKNRKNRKSRRN